MKKVVFSFWKRPFLICAIVVVLIAISFTSCVKPEDPELDPDPVITHTVKICVIGLGGEVSPYGEIEVKEGDNLLVEVKPSIGFTPDSIVVNGVISPFTGTVYNLLNVKSDHDIRFTFKKIPIHIVPTYTIEAIAGLGGKVNGQSAWETEVDSGSNLAFIFRADKGWRTDSIVVNGVKSPLTDSIYNLSNISSDYKIEAIFKIDYAAILMSGPWKQDSLLIRELDMSWSHYALWSVPGEYRWVYEFLPDGTFARYKNGGLFGDGAWRLDQDKDPMILHVGVNEMFPDGESFIVERLDKDSLTLARYDIENLNTGEHNGAVKKIHSRLRE